jgi:hypothetical protein
MKDASPAGPAIFRVLLGAFVAWQLVFILLSNVLSLFATSGSDSAEGIKSSPTIAVGEFASDVMKRWAELTGQLQGWALYAPHVPTRAVFVAVELRWDDDPRWPVQEAPRQLIRSGIEPDDPFHYFRPFGTFRLPCYEANLGLVMWTWDTEAFGEKPEFWRDALAANVRTNSPAIEAYLRWRLVDYVREHPKEPPPRQAVLVVRSYAIPAPGTRPWSWDGPTEQAVARWRPAVEVPPDYLPVEAFDPVTRRFEAVPQIR